MILWNLTRVFSLADHIASSAVAKSQGVFYEVFFGSELNVNEYELSGKSSRKRCNSSRWYTISLYYSIFFAELLKFKLVDPCLGGVAKVVFSHLVETNLLVVKTGWSRIWTWASKTIK